LFAHAIVAGKEHRVGQSPTANKRFKQLDGVMLANDGVKSGCRRHFIFSGRMDWLATVFDQNK
jgi:hypothetical protein